jgi:glutaminyl-peptide cyclotransferase
LRRGVDILHLIATPFPSVWHTLKDDASVVDLPTVEKLNKIFRIFVAEYLGLA